ncbi:MAG TPA: serine/threonine-protein kinase [Gemmatimonadales bacterium]|nr:serine/threonine-protein kinase [Gemmatimonadales bacterium]
MDAPPTPTFCARCGTSLGPGALFCPRCGTGIPVTRADAVQTVAMDAVPEPRFTMTAALRQATLGDYEILAELGHGGMATVYLAHDIALDRKVAIKVLAPAWLMMGEGMVERFKREARTAAALSHPHIIPIYAVKQTENIMYFVMKYVQGRPLDAVIRDVGRLPIPMIQAILAQVGDALGYAHRHGVIHRDIKSANIMIDEEGWAVVTDFGIAKVQEAATLTVTGVTVGTPAYMSPEQCATREVTGASDQYSLGVVAYEMLTGRLPFQSDSSMSVMYAHFNERPHDVTTLRHDCPANLSVAVMRMLEKEPEARWPSMEDVVAMCGRPSLRRDDPVRSEMITLAKAGGQSQLLTQLRTPSSPIAFAKARPRPSDRMWRRVSRLSVGLGIAALGLAAVLWVVTRNVVPWRSREPARQSADSTRAAAPPPPALVVTDTPVHQRAAVPSRPPHAAEPVRSVAAVVHQDDSAFTSLRATAVAAMSRARDAGATSDEMARGDATLRAADSLAVRGRLPEAMVQLATATSVWTEAERVARARATRDTVRPMVTAPPPAPVAAVDPRPQIEASLVSYAQALESRDTSRVRRAYPGLSAAQQQVWGDFFKSVRNLKATLHMTTIDVRGNSADAVVTGVYEFDNATTGRSERRAVTFRASFLSDSAGWRLSNIQ